MKAEVGLYLIYPPTLRITISSPQALDTHCCYSLQVDSSSYSSDISSYSFNKVNSEVTSFEGPWAQSQCLVYCVHFSDSGISGTYSSLYCKVISVNIKYHEQY